MLEGSYEEKDLPIANWKDELRMAQHMVLVDHQRRQVFLSIRGTKCLNDVLTDMQITSVPFCGGYAHAGAAMEARDVWDECKDALLNNMPKDYELVICGHSLGGSIGVLIRIMMEHYNVPHSFSRIRNFAFSSFPCFFSEEPVVLKDVTLVIHNNDIIPYLSVEYIRRLNQELSDEHDVALSKVFDAVIFSAATLRSAVSSTITVTFPAPTPTAGVPEEYALRTLS